MAVVETDPDFLRLIGKAAEYFGKDIAAHTVDRRYLKQICMFLFPDIQSLLPEILQTVGNRNKRFSLVC